MIDEIFEMIMKEARARPGKNLVFNINDVFRELSDRILEARKDLTTFAGRQQDHED